MNDNVPKVLVVSLHYAHTASYYDDWQTAFNNSRIFSATFQNINALSPDSVAKIRDDFDAVVLLHNCTADSIATLEPLAGALSERKHSRLVSFVGNEYNSPHCGLSDKIDVLRAARVDVVATQLLAEAGQYLYGDFANVIALPHALNETTFTPGPASIKRKVGLGFRGFRYNALIGDNERDRLIDYFEENGPARGLNVDIDWKQRFDRTTWAAFLQNAIGTVSAEAGSWYLDRDDGLVNEIYSHIKQERRGVVFSDQGPMRSLFRRLPFGVKQWVMQLLERGPIKVAALEDQKLDLVQLKTEFFDKAAKAPVYSKCVSSRHFDAIGTKTCQILLEGRYNDILKAGEHFIEVKRDLSNLDEVIAEFKDETARQAVVENAYQHVMDHHRYENRIRKLHATLAAL